MKTPTIFTVFVLLGLATVSGVRFQTPENPSSLERRYGAEIGNPFAPVSRSGRNVPLTKSLLNEARQALQPEADSDGEFTTTLNEPVVPAEYNGDVRSLPRLPPDDERIEVELDGPPNTRDINLAKTADAAAAQSPGIEPNVAAGPMPAPLQSFNGLSLRDDCSGRPCGIGHPPDPNGDVGLIYIIESVNEGIGIFTKTGTKVAAFTEDSLWAGANTGTPCDNHNQGDPVVIYDQLANRWILTNFAFGYDSNGYATSPFYQCFAVSKTGDPLVGGWWLYPLRTDAGTPGQPPPSTLADYPHFGNWNDGCLYMSANEFSWPSGRFIGTVFASLNKADMYNGQPLTSSLGFINNGSSPFTLIPSNISGAREPTSLPAAGTPNYFVSQSMDSFSFEVRKFTPGTSPKICGAGGSLSAPTKVAQTAFASPKDVSQRDTSSALQSLGERVMQKVQYRKVGGNESLWVVHSTEASGGSTVRPQWMQINVSGGSIRTTPVQQQIYAPDATFERWVPSMAADHDGNVALGYNISSAATFPGIAYSGRLAIDPLNQLPETEMQLVAGGGSQRNSCNGPCTRWGDYSSMSIDPQDDCTFWYVGEYYDSQANGDSGNWQTRIGSFRFPSCGGQVVLNLLTVTSVGAAGTVAITVGPDDENNQDTGSTPFTRTYRKGTDVTLTAPTVVGDKAFQKWQRDGVEFSTNASTTVGMFDAHTMTAVYATPATYTLTVGSNSPDSGVTISASPNDTKGAGGGTTGFTRTYSGGTVVTLTAPATAAGNNFLKWQRDGVDFATTASITVPMDQNRTLTAFYLAPAAVNITVETSPTGLSFTVDGTSYTSSQTFSWTPGSNHTIATTTTQSGGAATQFLWSKWSDGGTLSHTVSATIAKTYTANFTTQYMLTMRNGDGGIVFPISGFHNAGEAVNIAATEVSQFRFLGWVGTGAGSFTSAFRTGTVIMNGPVTETASFEIINTTLQLSAATYTANESGGVLNVTVTREGDIKSVVEVTYATTDGTAKEGRDYEAALGVLTFAKGETSKTIPVLIIDNGYVDPTRTINIKLSEVNGAFLGTTTSAVLTIAGNDSTIGQPVDEARRFVQYHYYDFLSRFPDTSGWDFWTNQINKCGSDAGCNEVARVNTSAAFFLSIEFQQTGYLVERIYKVAYGNATGTSTVGGNHQLSVPIIRFLEFLKDTEFIGRGVVVLQAGWEQQIESNKQLYIDTLIRTKRFTDAVPNSLTPDQFVDRLNQNGGNPLSASERTTLINLFGGAADSSNLIARAQVLRKVAEDPDLVESEKNRAFVLAQYFGYLRRNPDDAPEPTRDYSGYDFWLSKLNQFKGDFNNAEMVKAFITSAEYRQRFGQ